MAEAIGAASGLLGLTTATWQAGMMLYQTIQSYQTHPQRVLDLMNENNALNGVLSALQKRLTSCPDVDFSALELPLQRCKHACSEFEQEISKCSSSRGSSRTHFRDWARLRYMGQDIDGFRRLLASYKQTINIALTDATLHSTSLTNEKVESYNRLLQTATADLEDRLGSIDATLERLVSQNVEGSESEGSAAVSEIQQITDERLSTEMCLQICANLSDHIGRLQLAGTRGGSNATAESDLSSTSDSLSGEGLEEFQNSLFVMAKRLKQHEKVLFDRLLATMRASAASPKDTAEIERLRDEWESTHQSMEIMEKAGRKLDETVSVIENHGTGDTLQFMVSATGQPLRGINRGTGWRNRQFGGYMDNETIRQLSSDAAKMPSGIGSAAEVPKDASSPVDKEEDRKELADAKDISTKKGLREMRAESSEDSEFADRHGGGRKLECESPTAAAVEARRRQMVGAR